MSPGASRKITSGIYQVGGSWGSGIVGANIYLIADDGLTLVDTGFMGRLRDIVKSVDGLGYSLSSVRRVIVTHHHLDHTGNLVRLKELTGAQVVAHGADAPYIDGTLPQPGLQGPAWLNKCLASFNWLLRPRPVQVDLVVNDGDELPLLGGVQVVHTPGHTPGSICLWFKQKKVLIVGDLLAHRFGLRLPALLFTADLGEEIRSINKILEFDFEVICFGHGRPITKCAREAIVDFAAKVTQRYSR